MLQYLEFQGWTGFFAPGAWMFPFKGLYWKRSMGVQGIDIEIFGYRKQDQEKNPRENVIFR